VAWTLAEREALIASAGAEADCRGLVAAGGDGTVAAVLNDRPRVPVAALPAGTENLFARHFGHRPDPERLAGAIAAGRTCRVDLGSADGRRFALMAGLGFDADVVTRHHAARVRGGRLRTTHRAAYVEPVLRSSLLYRFPELSVTVEGQGGAAGPETLRGTTAFVFNLPRYALGLPFAPMARDDDGLLDVVVFRDGGALRALRYLWLVFRGLHLRRPGVFHRQARRVTIRSDADVPVQLDGDPGGRLLAAGEPWTAEVLPGAVEVVLPPGFDRLGRRARAADAPALSCPG
jgi:diacylglycerol kinase family enzyme